MTWNIGGGRYCSVQYCPTHLYILYGEVLVFYVSYTIFTSSKAKNGNITERKLHIWKFLEINECLPQKWRGKKRSHIGSRAKNSPYSSERLQKSSLCNCTAYRYTCFGSFHNFCVDASSTSFLCFLLCLRDKVFEIMSLFVVTIVRIYLFKSKDLVNIVAIHSFFK